MLGTTRKILGDDYLAVEVSEDRVVASKKITTLWAAFDQLSHDDPALAKIVLSILVVLEAREKGAGAGPRLFDTRRNGPG